jgi:hypothetical protein
MWRRRRVGSGFGGWSVTFRELQAPPDIQSIRPSLHPSSLAPPPSPHRPLYNPTMLTLSRLCGQVRTTAPTRRRCHQRVQLHALQPIRRPLALPQPRRHRHGANNHRVAPPGQASSGNRAPPPPRLRRHHGGRARHPRATLRMQARRGPTDQRRASRLASAETSPLAPATDARRR